MIEEPAINEWNVVMRAEMGDPEVAFDQLVAHCLEQSLLGFNQVAIGRMVEDIEDLSLPTIALDATTKDNSEVRREVRALQVPELDDQMNSLIEGERTL